MPAIAETPTNASPETFDMIANPVVNAEAVTGRPQTACVDMWRTTGFVAAISDVITPLVYDYGELTETTVAVTLYDVRRHVLIEDGKVRRDGRVQAGQFRIGQPGKRFWVDAVPDVDLGKLLLIYLGRPLLAEVGTALGRSRPIELLDRVWDVDDPFLATSAHHLVEASELASMGSGLLAEQMAYTLALHLSHRYAVLGDAPTAEPTGCDRPTLARIADYVRANVHRDLSLKELASVAGMSPSSLIRAFKSSLGTTPHRFVVEQRVRAARELLTSSKMSIAEIAIATGFASQSHLGAKFRALTGFAPGDYRRRHFG